MSTLDMLALINREDQTVALAVERELPQIAMAVDAIAARFRRGGRLFYVGAGTSGRLGVLDASECPPTFSVAPELFQGIIAGGDGALRRSSEGAEDVPEAGESDLRARGFAESTPDTLIGIAASGRTPYVLGAMAYAARRNALTIALTCVPGSVMARAAQMAITPVTGAEVLTGSTRMKAGTATKLVLNMISTGVMVRMGAVYGNLMVNVQPSNAKLIDRAERIIAASAGCDRETAAATLKDAGSVKVAIAMLRLGVDRSEAERRLGDVGGRLAELLDEAPAA
jgi:N-acetylmuramic acid 6-phosphate etherase